MHGGRRLILEQIERVSWQWEAARAPQRDGARRPSYRAAWARRHGAASCCSPCLMRSGDGHGFDMIAVDDDSGGELVLPLY